MNHPIGTYIISITEMFEKFSYYMFTGTLVLYMYEVLHFSVQFSALLYGMIVGSCYLSQIITGCLTDLYLGNRKAVIIGGILMLISQLVFTYDASLYYLTEAVPTHSTLLLSYPELIFIIGAIIFAIGTSFMKIGVTSFIGLFYENKEELLDSAYTIFYMISNIGPFIAPLILSIVVGIGYPHLYQYGFFIGALIIFVGLIAFLMLKNKYLISESGKKVGVTPISKMIVEKTGENIARSRGGNLTKIEKDRIKVIFLILIVFTLFYTGFEQILTSIIIIIIHYVNNTIPFTSITITPQTFISLNAIFILILSPIFIKLMPMLADRNKEPSSIGKLGIGTLLITVAYTFLLIPSYIPGKINMVWLVLFHIFLAMAELFTVPIGLSLISKLAPVRYRSLMMGILFTATAIAEVFSGVLASCVPTPGHCTKLFGLIQINSLSSFIWIFIILSGAFGIIWFLFKKRIQNLTHGIE